MNTYLLIWATTGCRIGKVRARTMHDAIRKAPLPYRKYFGEIYAVIYAVVQS